MLVRSFSPKDSSHIEYLFSLDSLYDSYLNPSQLLQVNSSISSFDSLISFDDFFQMNDERNVRSPSSVTKGQIIDIPVTFTDKQMEKNNYKKIDHIRTTALNHIAEERIEQK